MRKKGQIIRQLNLNLRQILISNHKTKSSKSLSRIWTNLWFKRSQSQTALKCNSKMSSNSQRKISIGRLHTTIFLIQSSKFRGKLEYIWIVAGLEHPSTNWSCLKILSRPKYTRRKCKCCLPLSSWSLTRKIPTPRTTTKNKSQTKSKSFSRLSSKSIQSKTPTWRSN